MSKRVMLVADVNTSLSSQELADMIHKVLASVDPTFATFAEEPYLEVFDSGIFALPTAVEKKSQRGLYLS